MMLNVVNRSTNWGAWIREARQARKMTQSELAAKLGISARTVGNWERGDTVPRSSLSALEQALGTAVGTRPPAPGPAGSEDVDRLIVQAILAADMTAAEKGEALAAYRRERSSPPQ